MHSNEVGLIQFPKMCEGLVLQFTSVSRQIYKQAGLYPYRVAPSFGQSTIIMPDLGCPSALQEQLWQQVHLLHSVQTAPFEAIVSDYTSCLQRKRDLEVRLCTLTRLYTMHGPTLPLLPPTPSLLLDH